MNMEGKSMSVKETIISVLDMLTEEQQWDILLHAEEFLTPNEETLSALEEAEYIATHPDEFKSFNTIEEMLEDLNSDD
ncbi:MAG: hypothetical protein K2F73_03770 [Ruminococcus sp.]|nr:hypothetical protein [Ruminococcus sp.]